MSNTFNRRRLLKGVAGAIAASKVIGATAAQDADGLTRENPDEEITVEPGTTLLFEVDEMEETTAFPEWYVDGEYEGLSMGPWPGAYAQETGAVYWQYEIEDDHEITAVVDPHNDDAEYSTSWTVETSPDGISEPSVDAHRPPTDEVRSLEELDTVDFELNVSDPDGNLDRVVWWAHAADYVLEITDVSGSEDTASITVDSDDLVQEGASAWVVSENGAITNSDGWHFAFDMGDSTFDISDVQTNSPIGGGETLEVTATITNTGDQYAAVTPELIVGHDSEQVDEQTMNLGPDKEQEVILTFEAGEPTGDREIFPGRISTEDYSIEFTIVVEEDGETPAFFEVAGVETNAPVGAGDTLEVTTRIENIGDETGRTDINLVVGHDPTVEDSEMLSLDPDESETLTFSFEAGDPAGGREEFPVEVDTGADTASEMVVVEDDGRMTPATFNVMGLTTNSPVGGGETLTVDATIENVGDETGRTDIELIVGHDPEVTDSTMLTLDPGESVTVTLTFTAGQPTGGREEFPVEIDTGADTASETVVVSS